MKKQSRRARHYYKLLDANNNQVNIDLNNYKCTCVVTGKRKSFYHKYLYELIVRKYNSNIDMFRTTYTSREAAPSAAQRKIERLNQSIKRAQQRVEQLTKQLSELQN